MVDFCAVDGGLVGATFIRHDDVFFVGEIGDEISREGEHGAERGMSVQETFAIETDEFGIDSALCENRRIAAGFDAGEVGLFRIEGETEIGLVLGIFLSMTFDRLTSHGLVDGKVAQELKTDARIFAAADGDKVAAGMKERNRGLSRGVFDDEMDEVVFGSLDIIKIEKLAKTVEKEFLEKRKLLDGKITSFDDESRATGGFIITNCFNHAKIEGDCM